jgi:GTP-dependent phosphoenolpyruvate carboxykinase
MKSHTVFFQNLNQPLQASATTILGAIGIESIVFHHKPLANQDYDFWWEGMKDGAKYQVRGDSWEPEEQQKNISVTISGNRALSKAKELIDVATIRGWSALSEDAA